MSPCILPEISVTQERGQGGGGVNSMEAALDEYLVADCP